MLELSGTLATSLNHNGVEPWYASFGCHIIRAWAQNMWQPRVGDGTTGAPTRLPELPGYITAVAITASVSGTLLIGTYIRLMPMTVRRVLAIRTVTAGERAFFDLRNHCVQGYPIHEGPLARVDPTALNRALLEFVSASFVPLTQNGPNPQADLSTRKVLFHVSVAF